MKTVFITMPIFGDGKHFGAVINWGEMEGENVVYETKNGIERRKPTEFQNCFKLWQLSDFDIEKSLKYWRDKNPQHYGKPFIVDETITTGEVWHQYTWQLSIMIFATDSEIKIKPVL